MLSGSLINAATFVIPKTPCIAAIYAMLYGSGRKLLTDEILIK
jgi:hypothetical protein